VLNGLAPVELLSTASHFVLSVIPLSSVIGDLELQIDLSSGFIPAGMPSSIDTFHTIDGFVVAPATPEPHSFGLTARRGLVQYVFRPYLIDRCAIVLQSSEKTIANTVERAIAKLAQFGVAGPFSILLTLTHAAALGATWAEHRPAGRTWSPKRDPLNLPTIVVDDGAGEHLEPLLRSLWFAFGIERTRGNAPGKPD
jgi:hypothetical protein